MTTPGEARETKVFAVPGLFHPVPKDAPKNTKPMPREAQLWKPYENQLTALLRMTEALERGQGGAREVIMFETLVASLFVEQSDWDDFERVRMAGQVNDSAYGDFVQTVIKGFFPNREQAPTNGPAPTRRRAAARVRQR